MSKKEPLHIRIDSDLKKESKDLFQKLGFDMTTACTIFLKQCVREGKIPFEISLDPSNAAIEKQEKVEE